MALLFSSVTGWEPGVLMTFGADEERARIVERLRGRGRAYLDRRGRYKTRGENARLTTAGRALTDEAAKIEWLGEDDGPHMAQGR